MKCDELTVIKIILNNHGKPMASIQGTTCYYGISPYATFCPQDEVDEAITELKAELRKTQRALWLARSAMCKTYDIRTYFIENPESKRRFIDFFVLMQKAAATAAIKAEEY